MSKKLQELSLNNISQMIEGMPGGFFIYKADESENLIYYNSTMVEYFECASNDEFENYVQNSFKGIVYPEDLPEVERLISNQVSRQEKQFDHVKYRIVTKRGNTKYLQDYGRLVNDKTYGNVYFVFVIDITAEVESELKGKQHIIDTENLVLDQYKVLSSIGNMYYCLYDVDMNDYSYTQIVSNEEIVDKLFPKFGNAQESFRNAIGDIVYPKYVKSLEKFLDFSTLNERLKGQDFLTIKFESYSIGWSEGCFIACDHDPNGDVSRVLWAVRKLNYAQALEDEQRANETIAQIYAALGSTRWSMRFNTQGEITNSWFSKDLCEYIGYDYEMYGHDYNHIFSLIYEEDREKLVTYIRAIRSHDSQSYMIGTQLRLMVRDMGYHWFRVKCLPSYDAAGNIVEFNGILTDIDEQKRLMIDLEDAKQHADAANRAKSSFLFNMSHDIRTPMNAILGFSNLAEHHLNEPKIISKYLRNINHAGDQLLSIINNVLELARIENGKLTVKETPVNMEEAFIGNMIIFESEAKKHNLTFTTEVDIEHKFVYLDVSLINEVFLNLVSNAIKYTPEGGKVEVVVKEKAHQLEDWVTFELMVKDNGIGMSEEFQKHIFEAFERERNSTTSGIQGTGLGMGIVKKLVDLMDGTIEIHSKLNEGSTFIVSIPHRIVKDESLVSKKDELDVSAPVYTGKRILLAEDNELNAEIATELLTMQGFIVDVARNGQVCVDMYQKAPFNYYDLILMDVQMPIMNGYEATKVIRTLKSEKANIPIFAMTANAFEQDRLSAIDAGMNGHIAKPIDVNKLKESLQSVLKE